MFDVHSAQIAAPHTHLVREPDMEDVERLPVEQRGGERVHGDDIAPQDELVRMVQLASARAGRLRLEFYIISGGLQDLVQGTKIAKEFSAIYGCTLDEDADGKCIKWIKRCITFTEKTRYLSEINKGIRPTDVLNHH